MCCVIFIQNNIESFTSRITEYWLSIAALILPVKQTKILKRWWRFTPGHPPKIKLVPFLVKVFMLFDCFSTYLFSLFAALFIVWFLTHLTSTNWEALTLRET